MYEKRLLHKRLNIPPQALVVTADVPNDHGKERSGPGNQEETREIDMDLQSEDESRHSVEERGNPDENGRYDIQERRRTHQGRTNGAGRFNPLTVYTEDEDDEDEDEDLSDDEVAHRAYASAESDDDDDREGRMSRRRSYWLSKGKEPYDRDDDDAESS